MRHRQNVPVILVASGLLALATLVPSPHQAAAANSTPVGAVATPTTALKIKNFAFNPSSVSVAKGTRLTWTNRDSSDHRIKSTSGPASFASKHLGKRSTYSVTLTRKGTYKYKCSIHPEMRGTITVR